MERSVALRNGWLVGVVALSVLAGAGCPPSEDEADAAIDGMRRRPDAPEFDAFLDPTLDADLDAVVPPPIDAPGLDAPGLDAPFIDAPPDAGPIVQCDGVIAPAMPCTNDDECRAMGRTRCNIPTIGFDMCPPCGEIIAECLTDSDCVERARTDAGAIPLEGDDAGLDAGPRPDAGDPSLLVCVTYGERCACPQRRCELPCTGPSCGTARCDTGGYTCPANSQCEPSADLVDDHGCAPRACTTSSDCECGFCTRYGLCATGAGRCE